MNSTWFLFLSTLLISLTAISLGAEENWVHSSNIDSGIHLTLQPVHHNTSKADLLDRDEARVWFINNRINTNTTKTTGRKSSLSAEPLSTYHEVQENNSPGGGVSVPLKPGESIGSGNYYVVMGLGTPVNYYDMVIDTGSSLTWLQCKPCLVHCHPQADPIFNPSASNTYIYVPCSAPQCADVEVATDNPPMCSIVTGRCMFEATYGDGSYSNGYLSQDTLTLSGTSTPTLAGFTFGCAEDTQGMFGGAAGLIGLGRNNISLSAQLSPKYGFVFAYCLPTITSNGGGTGTLSIGRTASYNSPNKTASFEFTPMLTNPDIPSLYFVNWTGMLVNGKPLKGVSSSEYGNNPTILDSGTVISRIPTHIYEALQIAFVEAMPLGYVKAPAYSIFKTCYSSTSSNMLQGVPKMIMVFQGGAQLRLGPLNVVTEVEGVSCLAFAGNSGTDGITIIGNTQQQASTILYDVDNSKIGLASASSDCSSQITGHIYLTNCITLLLLSILNLLLKF